MPAAFNQHFGNVDTLVSMLCKGQIKIRVREGFTCRIRVAPDGIRAPLS